MIIAINTYKTKISKITKYHQYFNAWQFLFSFRCRWWRCIRRWLGEFTTNLHRTFRNVDLLANSAFLWFGVS